jgi:glycosyltransferase involved in cell wall biosynthesis
MKILIDALGASAGGGLTYLWNVLPLMAEQHEMSVSVLADRAARLSSSGNVTIVEAPTLGGATSRFLWEQFQVPKLIRQTGSDVLLCTGNFAIWKSPVPQILLSRNSLYTSPDFSHDLRRRHEYRLLLDTQLKAFFARQSIRRAEVTFAPSQAFARELENWAGRKVGTLYHGFDQERFCRDTAELPLPIKKKLQAAAGTVRLLFVSHYNYYRNFETLLRAVPLLRQRMPSRKFRLVLTCELLDRATPGGYRTEQARKLVRDLGMADDIVQLGSVPYSQLHHVYRACDIYVTAAYTETFAHPLVEAMASGLPIVASNIPVHKEITDGAALLFEKFSPADLADKVHELVSSPSKSMQLRENGLRRFRDFSWKKHVGCLLEMARNWAVSHR